MCVRVSSIVFVSQRLVRWLSEADVFIFEKRNYSLLVNFLKINPIATTPLKRFIFSRDK